jgi:hypothetical protein
MKDEGKAVEATLSSFILHPSSFILFHEHSAPTGRKVFGLAVTS